jgi:26S proteasome regulatory subunit N1
MMSATTSLGLSLLWDTDLGLSHVDRYTYSSSEYIKAGALLATDILNSGVRMEANVAKGLVGEYVDNKSVPGFFISVRRAVRLLTKCRSCCFT